MGEAARCRSPGPGPTVVAMTTTDCKRLMYTCLTIAMALALALLLGACGSEPEGHALGTVLDTEFVDQVSGESQGDGSVAVTDVRRGSIDELGAAFDLDAEEKAMSPVYVDVAFTNDGDAPVDLHAPSGRDGDDNILSPLVVIELGEAPPYEPCPALPEQLAPGSSVTGCAIVLVPEDAELERVSYLGGAGQDVEYWLAS